MDSKNSLHVHERQHDHHRFRHPGEGKRLAMAIGLTLLMMVVEVVGGFWTNSLALLSDAGHMLTHVLALLISAIAMRYAALPPSKNKTYGFYRLEVLAALFNGFTVIGVSIFIGVMAWVRLLQPERINSDWMLLVSIAGLVVNVLTAWILIAPSKNNINLQGAFLHVMSDALSSVAVIVVAIVMKITGFVWLDPVVSVIIGVVIVVWGYRLIRSSIHILLEGVPEHIDTDVLIEHVTSRIDEVSDIHDVHVWTMTSGMHFLTAHVKIKDMLVSESEPLSDRIAEVLFHDFAIDHAILQFETARDQNSACDPHSKQNKT